MHTYIHTYIQTYIHTYIHAYIHTCMHACMHAQLTHIGLYVDVIAKELALSEATWCYWISVFSIVYLAGNQSLILNLPHTTCSAPILHHLFSLSCFPHAIFTFLLLLVGRSWHVGLSGPLIFVVFSPWFQHDCFLDNIFGVQRTLDKLLGLHCRHLGPHSLIANHQQVEFNEDSCVLFFAPIWIVTSTYAQSPPVNSVKPLNGSIWVSNFYDKPGVIYSIYIYTYINTVHTIHQYIHTW